MGGPHRLREGYQECRLLTRQHARTFFFASHVLPAEKRASAYAVYAFCRRADNIVDRRGPVDPLRELRELREGLAVVYGDGDGLDAAMLALRDTVLRHGIPREYFDDLVRGVEMDLTTTRYETFAELEEYCYCVASVVGLMMTRIFGVTDPAALRQAEDMGTAMQLTNILRDVGEDYRMGRVYIPLEDLRAHGCDESAIAEGRVDAAFISVMKFEIDRARRYYAQAEPGLECIPDDGSQACARLMSTAYAAILERIEENGYDTLSRRAVVPLAGKLRLAAAMLLTGRSAVRGRTQGPPAPVFGSHGRRREPHDRSA